MAGDSLTLRSSAQLLLRAAEASRHFEPCRCYATSPAIGQASKSKAAALQKDEKASGALSLDVAVVLSICGMRRCSYQHVLQEQTLEGHPSLLCLRRQFAVAPSQVPSRGNCRSRSRSPRRDMPGGVLSSSWTREYWSLCKQAGSTT